MASPRCLIVLLMVSGSHEWRFSTTESDHQRLNTSNQSSANLPLSTPQHHLSTSMSLISPSPQAHFTTSTIPTPTASQHHLSTSMSLISPSPQAHFTTSTIPTPTASQHHPSTSMSLISPSPQAHFTTSTIPTPTASQHHPSTSMSLISPSPQAHFTTSTIPTPTASQHHPSTSMSLISPSPQAHFTISEIQTTNTPQFHPSTSASLMSPSTQTFPDKEDSPKNVSVSISPSGEIVEGSSVTLTCSSDANPPVEIYTWFKGTISLRTGKNYTMYMISSGDSGEYTCQAKNKHGNQSSTAVSVNVLYHPKIVSVSISPSGEIVEGSSVTLTCSSDANPPVENYTWFKGTTSVGNEKTYTISSISSEDSGEYKCKCSNEVGHQESSSVTLNVLYPPKNVSVAIHPAGEDNLVTLKCSSDANPPAKDYTWFNVKESSAVGSGPSYKVLQSGQYYCEAQNKHGSERSAVVSVTLRGGSVVAYVFVGFGLFGLAAFLSAFFWLRYKRQKKQTDDDIYQNAGPSAKEDTYAALDRTGQTSEDVYHTLATSHPSPDADTSSEYYNLETVKNFMKK